MTSVAAPTSSCCARTSRRTSIELCDEHRTTWRREPAAGPRLQGPGLRRGDVGGSDAHRSPLRRLSGALRQGRRRTGVHRHRRRQVDPRLVRGFDYYTRTTFEFVADALGGAQNAIGGGGRYDKLAEQLGGKPTSGIGFGSGIERLLLTREAEGVEPRDLVNRALDLFVIDTTGDDVATALVDELRARRIRDGPGLRPPVDEVPDEGGRQIGRAARALGRAPGARRRRGYD